MNWLFIVMGIILASFGLGVIVGLRIGRKLGIEETQNELHVVHGKEATKRFRELTGLGGED